jgi:stress response protein SCP2
MGDNISGRGDGDLETINISFNKIPTRVHVVMVIVTCFAGSFINVPSVTVRLLESGGDGESG